MKQLNKLRAKMIYTEYGNGNCSIECSDILKRYLKNCPSIIEKRKCKHKGCLSRNADFLVPLLGVDANEFSGNIANLERAVMANFTYGNSCSKCRQPYHSFERTCGHHLFIQVIFELFK